MSEELRLVIRTPEEVVFDGAVMGARVPTHTGLVGLRPRGEPVVLAIEPGLVILQLPDEEWFAATVGGLLRSDRTQCTLLSPVAAVGRSEEEMEQALGRMRASSSSEVALRHRLEQLEHRIVSELKTGHRGPRKDHSVV